RSKKKKAQAADDDDDEEEEEDVDGPHLPSALAKMLAEDDVESFAENSSEASVKHRHMKTAAEMKVLMTQDPDKFEEQITANNAYVAELEEMCFKKGEKLTAQSKCAMYSSNQTSVSYQAGIDSIKVPFMRNLLLDLAMKMGRAVQMLHKQESPPMVVPADFDAPAADAFLALLPNVCAKADAERYAAGKKTPAAKKRKQCPALDGWLRKGWHGEVEWAVDVSGGVFDDQKLFPDFTFWK
ncbi:hypothetical protein TeGR_g12666, partial [Tetraparma gracilis]